MKKLTSLLVVVLTSTAALAFSTEGFTTAGTLKVKADRVAADRASDSFLATGNVEAVTEPYRLQADSITKDGDTFHLHEPSMLTTCTNELDSLHWKIEGDIEYRDGKYVRAKNVWLYMFNVPVLWVPYWYYPIDDVEGLRMMVGQTGRWGWFLMTKYVYNIYTSETGAYHLRAASRLDLREENGVAVGQSLHWTLGDYGAGKFKVYYASDEDYDRYAEQIDDGTHKYGHTDSEVDKERYALSFRHQMDLTERDIFNVHASLMSDSRMYDDFLKPRFGSLRNEIFLDTTSAASIEHVENWAGAGISVAAPLNYFYSGKKSLPEIYFDVNPRPLFNTGINYESQSSIGYFARQRARLSSSDPVYRYVPGIWASYETFRIDSYHRLSKPMKYNDWLSVVPRVGYRGTFYGDGGYRSSDGTTRAGSTDNYVFRSIFEAGTTLSARGVAWVDDEWQTIIEPYMDILLQRSVTSGLSGNERNYVFDSVDMSCDWSDQFAGRGRNLPYSYYGITPGFRKLYRKVNESGSYDGIFDFDVYAAINFGKSKDKKDYMQYGEHSINFTPGFRARWKPGNGTMLGVRAEYNPDESELALAEISFSQKLTRDLKLMLTFSERNHRYYDYSISPGCDEYNRAYFSFFTVELEHEIVDWLAWGPFVRWDCNENEYDQIGAWVDLRTDCLGFRFQVSERNSCTRTDGAQYSSDTSYGAYIYLRAMGAESGNPFSGL